MLDFEKLIYNTINTESKPVIVSFEYSRAAEDIEKFLLYELGEDDAPEDDEIQSIEFDLYIWNMDNFNVECTLHGDAGDYFIGDYIESMHNATEWLEQIPVDIMAGIKTIFKEEDQIMEFTEKELYLLSCGILQLIEDAGQAKKLLHAGTSAGRVAIDDYIKELQALNSKVCDTMQN